MAAVSISSSQRRTPPMSPDRQRKISGPRIVLSSATSIQTTAVSTNASAMWKDAGVAHHVERTSQEMQIYQASEELVAVGKGTMSDSYFTRFTLPPSPPASIDHEISFHEDAALTLEESVQMDKIVFNDTLERPFTEPISPPLERASTDSKAVRRTPAVSSPPVSFHGPALHVEPQRKTDAPLQPMSSFSQRPVRRNTTGSATKHPAAVSTSIPFTGELESDIQMHAESIRQERLSKRAKRQQEEAEFALTRQRTADRDKLPDEPIVGKWIREDHDNYVLMYNMLTGIRIGVSRCQAKIKRPLTEVDFSAKHKYSFDIVGNELTPSAKYDFKFKDYAPWVFRSLREDHFHLDPADYLLSLTVKYILSELGSPGKSGSFFYFSRDYRYIIKTIHHSEHSFLLRILPQYYEHVKANPHTLLSRFYGLHRVKLPRGRKIHFVIMNNLFPPHRDIHETYDLKGSTIGREYPEEKAAKNPRATLKDVNWINRGKTLELGPEKRAFLIVQLERDAEFLKRVNVMDYSLLIGIHHMQRGNKDNVRRNTLKVFSPDLPTLQRRKALSHGTSSSKNRSPEAMAMRRALYRTSGSKPLDSIQLPDDEVQQGSLLSDRQQMWFYQDEGGLRATGESNDPMNTIYYLGVIDILTPYGWFKRVEHLLKGLQADIHKISPVPPSEYAERFVSFMKASMPGGEGGARFKAE